MNPYRWTSGARPFASGGFWMKHYKQNASLLFLATLLLLPVPAPCLQTETNARAPEVLRQQVIDLERQAREATLKRDPEFSERTLSDDYVAITPLGQVINKTDNTTQGGYLTWFYRNCAMRSGVKATDGASITPGDAFLVVPVPVGLPTINTLCNGKSSTNQP